MDGTTSKRILTDSERKRRQRESNSEARTEEINLQRNHSWKMVENVPSDEARPSLGNDTE